MYLSVIEIDNKKLFEGVKVRHKINGRERTIIVLHEGKKISDAVTDGTFNPVINVEYQTVMLNKHLFDIIEDQDF